MNIIFTVCNRSSLAHALALGHSVMQYPENIFYIGWVDTIGVPDLPAGIRLIPVEEVHIPDWEKMVSHYYDFELLPACRPWFAKHLLTLHEDQGNLVFFAPTVLILNPFDEIMVREADLFLTPSISMPLKNSAVLDDKRILNTGMFQSGSWIMRGSKETRKFLEWWAVRTIDRAKFDLCNGMCLDQLWLNYAPVMIPDTVQISNPAWHYGLHSVLNHSLEYQNGQYTIAGNALISVDFAGLEVFDPVWSDYAGLISQSKTLKKIHADYRKSLARFQSLKPSGTKPGYGLIPEIRKNRMLRKKAAGQFKSVLKFIDQFTI